MVYRPDYINKLLKYRDVPVVKILSGIRRCGKSTLLEMYKQTLISLGVPQSAIIERQYAVLTVGSEIKPDEMFKDLSNALQNGGRYFLLDEVQEVDGWEKAINALNETGAADIYVTGSNSRLMAGEISTYLTGRYVQIPVFTLSFGEYIEFKKSSGKTHGELLNEYIRFGGFPIIALNEFDTETVYQIAEGIYSSIVAGDICRRHKINDQELFERVALYITENVGETFSANSVCNFLKSERRGINTEAIYNYIKWLEQAFVVYRCPRFDLQGKSALKTQEKFFVADNALMFCARGFDPRSIASIMENIVFFELKRRGYEVYVGKNGTKEIDFVCMRADSRLYIQVTRTLPENSDREEANLLEIKDNYPKFIVTLDEYATGTIRGIEVIHLKDFLLSDKF